MAATLIINGTTWTQIDPSGHFNQMNYLGLFLEIELEICGHMSEELFGLGIAPVNSRGERYVIDSILLSMTKPATGLVSISTQETPDNSSLFEREFSGNRLAEIIRLVRIPRITPIGDEEVNCGEDMEHHSF